MTISNKDFEKVCKEVRNQAFDDVIKILKDHAWCEEEKAYIKFDCLLVPVGLIIKEVDQLKEGAE